MVYSFLPLAYTNTTCYEYFCLTIEVFGGGRGVWFDNLIFGNDFLNLMDIVIEAIKLDL